MALHGVAHVHARRKEEEIMRRLFSTAHFVEGLVLLSTGGVLVGMVLLVQAEYPFREVDHVTEEEPVLTMPADTAAILEQQVPRGSSAPSSPPRSSLRPRTSASQRATPPIQSQPTVVGKVRVNQVDEDNSIVDGETLRLAIEEVEKTLSLMMPRVSAALSPGMGLSISSAAGTATLDSQGFTVTGLNGKLRQRFGLQVGDTIVSLNGHPVNSLHSAMRIFQNLFVKNRDLTELRLEIYRRGALLYKTYRITWR
jgi:hypothetical protein